MLCKRLEAISKDPDDPQSIAELVVTALGSGGTFYICWKTRSGTYEQDSHGLPEELESWLFSPTGPPRDFATLQVVLGPGDGEFHASDCNDKVERKPAEPKEVVRRTIERALTSRSLDGPLGVAGHDEELGIKVLHRRSTTLSSFASGHSRRSSLLDSSALSTSPPKGHSRRGSLLDSSILTAPPKGRSRQNSLLGNSPPSNKSEFALGTHNNAASSNTTNHHHHVFDGKTPKRLSLIPLAIRVGRPLSKRTQSIDDTPGRLSGPRIPVHLQQSPHNPGTESSRPIPSPRHSSEPPDLRTAARRQARPSFSSPTLNTIESPRKLGVTPVSGKQEQQEHKGQGQGRYGQQWEQEPKKARPVSRYIDASVQTERPPTPPLPATPLRTKVPPPLYYSAPPPASCGCYNCHVRQHPQQQHRHQQQAQDCQYPMTPESMTNSPVDYSPRWSMTAEYPQPTTANNWWVNTTPPPMPMPTPMPMATPMPIPQPLPIPQTVSMPGMSFPAVQPPPNPIVLGRMTDYFRYSGWQVQLGDTLT